MKAKLLALGFSALIAVIFTELALRMIYEPPPTWLEPQVHHERSPLLGWVLPRNLTDAWVIDAPVRTNALGLRDDEIPLEKPAGERRILCLGDSFTFALGVRFEDLYVQKLERTLNERHAPQRFQVINAGVAGYNTRQELIYLLAQGLDFEPDLITVGFYWNDLIANDEPLPEIETTPMRVAQPERRPPPSHTLPSWLRDSLRQSQLVYTTVTRTKTALAILRDEEPREIDKVQRALVVGDYEYLEPYWTTAAQRLGEIAQVGRDHGIPIVLVVFPMENQIQQDLPDLVFSERLREIWEPTGNPFVDLEPAYRDALNRGDNPFLPYDLHPGEKGMQIAADKMYGVIIENRLLGLGGASAL